MENGQITLPGVIVQLKFVDLELDFAQGYVMIQNHLTEGKIVMEIREKLDSVI